MIVDILNACLTSLAWELVAGILLAVVCAGVCTLDSLFGDHN